MKVKDGWFLLLKSKKLQAIEAMERMQRRLACPYCGAQMAVADAQQLACTGGHSFDFSRSGYVNLLTRPAESRYDAQLFQARRQLITAAGLFTPLHDTVADLIRQFGRFAGPYTLLDAGCGEGSHLALVAAALGEASILGVGIDISRDAAALASKAYPGYIWLVGDLARLPFRDSSFSCVLNCLSPSNYREFQRILEPEGIVVKVVPGADHLRELRAFQTAGTGKNAQRGSGSSNDTAALFERQLSLLDRRSLRYAHTVGGSDISDLLAMSPLAWSTDNDEISRAIGREAMAITIHLEVLTGTKRAAQADESAYFKTFT